MSKLRGNYRLATVAVVLWVGLALYGYATHDERFAFWLGTVPLVLLALGLTVQWVIEGYRNE